MVSTEFENKNYYNDEVVVKLNFNRGIESHELKINNIANTCATSDNIATCTLSVSSLDDGKVALNVSGEVYDEYGTNANVDKDLGNIVIDNTNPLIDGSLIGEGYYNSSSSFNVKLKVTEVNLDTSSFDIGKITTNACSVVYKSLVKYSGYYLLTLTMSDCKGTSTLDIDIDEGAFVDLAGNLSEEAPNLGNSISINNNSFGASYTNREADYISYSITSNNYEEIEIDFGREIKSYC